MTDEHTGEPLTFYKYRIEDEDGQVLARGITDATGHTVRVHTGSAQALRVLSDEE